MTGVFFWMVTLLSVTAVTGAKDNTESGFLGLTFTEDDEEDL